ncbi:MAG: PD40 domain-containing protein [Bacteroidales bacterium]|nr:PD40 domain-containing protein [Bacteroidales bacterium]
MVKRVFFLIVFVLTAPFVSAQTDGNKPSLYKVELMSFNSAGFSEISPVIVKDGLVFCSDKRFSIIRDRTSFDGRRLYNIYLAEMKDSLEWENPKELKSERNSLFNNGPFCMAPDNKTVYFTSEIETGPAAKSKKFRNHSGIFIAELSGTNLVSLHPFKYNSTEYDLAQPSISSDGKYLYFASNMPGGLGGSDLFCCESKDGEWSQPVNLGPGINSSGTENFPFIHPSGRLYFTSNRSGGIGSLDIYFTAFTNGKWDDPVLLPEPVNSSSDDFSFVADGSLQKGYFSSNRGKSDDIYNFVYSIIRKASCDNMAENSYCYRFVEENSAKIDTLPFRYDWSFGDGNKASGKMVEHCYESPGTYIVQLDVVNLITQEVSYNEKSDTLIVTKIEQAFISAPDTIGTGQRIMLNADETNLPGWKINQYYWNFGDETIAIGNRTDKTFLKPGLYNVQLIVSAEPESGGALKETCVSKNILVVNEP